MFSSCKRSRTEASIPASSSPHSASICAGLPDSYVEHAKPAQMLAECGLDESGIEEAVRQRLQLLNI